MAGRAIGQFKRGEEPDSPKSFLREAFLVAVGQLLCALRLNSPESHTERRFSALAG